MSYYGHLQAPFHTRGDDLNNCARCGRLTRLMDSDWSNRPSCNACGLESWHHLFEVLNGRGFQIAMRRHFRSKTASTNTVTEAELP